MERCNDYEFAGLPIGCPMRVQVCPLIKAGRPAYRDAPMGDAKPSPELGTFTDSRDGRVYKTVRIGRQVWLAENLAFDYAGSKCYDNDLANVAKYGRLYDWETAKKAMPPGWHLPSKEEWQGLVDFAGGDDVAGNRLKAASGWNSGGNGTDDYSFSALPGGDGLSYGVFLNAGYFGYWWSATEYDDSYAWYRYMSYRDAGVARNYYDKTDLRSVRCVQDCAAGDGAC